MNEGQRLKAVDDWAQSQPNLPQHLWSEDRRGAESRRQGFGSYPCGLNGQAQSDGEQKKEKSA